MIKIELHGVHAGKFVVFDDDQEVWVKPLTWYGSTPKRSKTTYARAQVHSGNGKELVFAHHMVIGVPPKGHVTDHINGDGLDNRKANLRHVSQSENMKAAFALHGDKYAKPPQKRGGVRTTIKYLADGTPRTYFYDAETRKRLTETEALKRFGDDIPERTKAGLRGSKTQTELQTEQNEGDE